MTRPERVRKYAATGTSVFVVAAFVAGKILVPARPVLKSEILWGQAKSLVLAGPFSREIAHGRDSNAPR